MWDRDMDGQSLDLAVSCRCLLSTGAPTTLAETEWVAMIQGRCRTAEMIMAWAWQRHLGLEMMLPASCKRGQSSWTRAG